MASEVAQKLRAIALLAAVLLNFPLLGIFRSGNFVAGIPALYAYLLMIWILILFWTAWTIEMVGSKNRQKRKSKE